MRLKCWVPFFGVLCDFVVLGGLGGYPLQQIFWWPSDIYRNWVGKKNGTKIVAFHAKMPDLYCPDETAAVFQLVMAMLKY